MAAHVSRRACLSVPGDSERMLAKGAGIEVDEVVIDLEDAVLPERKALARELAVSALAGSEWRAGAVSVRVNVAGSPWCHEDVAALAAGPRRPDTIVLPKVESAGDLAFAERLLAGCERAGGGGERIGVQALIETAAGVARVVEIAGASERLVGLILGYADLDASLGGSRDASMWGPVQDAVLVAARAHGLQAIDGPFLGVADDGAFRAAAGRAAALGFDGKWAIHPVQVGALLELFSPSADEVARAQAVIDSLGDGARGAVTLDGAMVDEAVRLAAERVLARAARVGPEVPA
jgi:citrate lyase subunit beta/citryl-CoA lyase